MAKIRRVQLIFIHEQFRRQSSVHGSHGNGDALMTSSTCARVYSDRVDAE